MAVATLVPTQTALEVTCAICEGCTREVFSKNGVWIRDCQSCGHRFALPPQDWGHVAATYSDDYFFGGGAGYSNYLSESTLLRQHGQRYGRLLKRFGAPGRLLDVGAAAGFILQGLKDEGWNGSGVEPNAAMARHAREELGINVSASSFEDFSTDEPFDAISIIQVMAHFVDPREALRNIDRLLKPGGVCVVETWNVQSWSAQLFGQGWHEYSPPSVLHWFAPSTLGRLFEQFGFQQLAVGRPQKWIEVGHAKSLLKHKAQESFLARLLSLAATPLPSRWQIPYPSEDLFWAVYRKN